MSTSKLKFLVCLMLGLTICMGCALFTITSYASSVGGVIVDKIYQPEHTYVYTYTNPTTHKKNNQSIAS